MTITRFAPSPTGRLHLGHAASAMLAHDVARARGGTFLLRIEDIDLARCREEHVASILDDLRWLGLDWDGPVVRQSERLPLYTAALDQLKTMDLLYPCFCRRSDIIASASAPQGPDGPLYPGTCRTLDSATRHHRIATEPHCWRLDMAAAADRAGPLEWQDGKVGTVTADPLAHGDVVLARKDAPVAYHFAVTIDDAAQGITDIVRGEDLFAATHVHRLLQALLDLPTPRWHHHGLVTDETGQRLAKRDNAPALASLRANGADPRVLLANLRQREWGIGSAATCP